MPSAASPVTISYNQLVSSDPSLSSSISRAFSSAPSSLGLLIVKDLPAEFPRLRTRLLHLSNAFASLPEHVRERYADEASGYLFGWSQGKEVMNGRPDTLKGSYYNNPTYEVEDEGTSGEEKTGQGRPARRLRRRNVWPREPETEGFQQAFQDLCKLMVEVGTHVARACEAFVRGESGEQQLANAKSVEELVGQSRSNKARLLHYVSKLCGG